MSLVLNDLQRLICYLKKKKKKKKNFYSWKEKTKQDFELFLHMLLKLEIISVRIGQDIELQNNINISETPSNDCNFCEILYICFTVSIFFFFLTTLPPTPSSLTFSRSSFLLFVKPFLLLYFYFINFYIELQQSVCPSSYYFYFQATSSKHF